MEWAAVVVVVGDGVKIDAAEDDNEVVEGGFEDNGFEEEDEVEEKNAAAVNFLSSTLGLDLLFLR